MSSAAIQTSSSAGTGNDRPQISRRPRRNDIQGIRAICMIQVLLYHAWHVGSPIGVDAFIMISAFLMTGSFLRRAEAGRMPFFLERWANTFKRLLPPLVFVVLVTLWGAIRFLSPRLAPEMVTQAFASLGYWENWRLVYNSADYYAINQAAASPFQHLWSMSMQGQVFLAWPLLMTIAVLLARLLKANIRLVAGIAFGLLTAGSLIWLMTAGQVDPAAAYFNTFSRVWEFSLGSVIAAAEPLLRNRWSRIAPFATWAGLGTLVLFCLVNIGTYPGPMAAVPMIAVALILVFGDAGPRTPQRFLSVGPLVWLGNISYCVYLVHWPLFVFFLSAVDRPRMTVMDGIVMILLSLVVAYALTRLLDDPVRLWPWANRSAWRKGLVVLVSLAVGNGIVLVQKLDVEENAAAAAEALLSAGDAEHPGARLIAGDTGAQATFTSEPIPDPAVGFGWTELPNDCTQATLGQFKERDNDWWCLQDFTGAASASKPIILVIGSSHDRQLLPHAYELGQRIGLPTQAVLRARCHLGEQSNIDASKGCAQYHDDVLKYVKKIKPAYVITTSTLTTADSPDEHLLGGFDEMVRDITAAGIEVIGVRDNLRSDENLLDCAVRGYEDGNQWGCQWSRSGHFAPTNPADALESIPGFHSIDLTDYYCFADTCPGIIGNIYVYMDFNHVSRQYAETMGTVFADRVIAQLGLEETGPPAATADSAQSGGEPQDASGQSGASPEDGQQSSEPEEPAAEPQPQAEAEPAPEAPPAQAWIEGYWAGDYYLDDGTYQPLYWVDGHWE